MKYAKKKGLCSSIPEKQPLDVRLSTVEKDRRFLDKDELKSLIEVIKNNRRYYVLINLLVASGLRQEEAFALMIDDFTVMKNGNVNVRINKTDIEVARSVFEIVYDTKTDGSKRTITIPYQIYKMVEDYYYDTIQNETEFQRMERKANGTDKLIFVNKFGKVINKRTFQRNFRDYIAGNSTGRKGIDFEATLHMFRHSFVSLQSEEVGIEVVAGMIGDSIATTEKIYNSLTGTQRNKVCSTSMSIFNSINGIE